MIRLWKDVLVSSTFFLDEPTSTRRLNISNAVAGLQILAKHDDSARLQHVKAMGNSQEILLQLIRVAIMCQASK